MYLVLSYTYFQMCFMLSVQNHIGISCSHCWSEFIVCWASNFPLIHHFYARAWKCIHMFWVIYLLIMEIHSLSTQFENAYFRMLRKSFSLNGCNVIIGWLLGFSYFESMSPCFACWWLHWELFVCSDLKCFVILMNSFRYLTCLTRQLWKLVLQSFCLCNDNSQYV